MKKTTIHLFKFLFVVGILLIVTNVIGLFTSLRSPYLITEINKINPGDITLSEEQVYSLLKKDTNDIKTYVKKANLIIHQGVAHYWEDGGATKYNLRIPIQENFILFLGSFVWPERFNKFEFSDYKRGLERGVGLCSQHAIILSEILYEQGIKTHIVGLSGHVVITALVDNVSDEWWILDPDYGVTIPYNLATLEKNPKLIAPYYSIKGYSEPTISNLENIYDKKGNFISSGNGMGDYSILTHYFENISYIAIWVIPILLMGPFIYYKIYWKHRKRKNVKLSTPVNNQR